MSERSDDGWYQGRVATQCNVSEKLSPSSLLDSRGKPIPYQQPPKCGFDLTPSKSGKGE